MYRWFNKSNYKITDCLPYCRAPLIKLQQVVDDSMTIDIDITVNNLLGEHNTDLIKKYLSLDARAKYLCFFVKYFMKKVKIHGGSVVIGYFSSYATSILM